MRISDWSSDVCSSDLRLVVGHVDADGVAVGVARGRDGRLHPAELDVVEPAADVHDGSPCDGGWAGGTGADRTARPVMLEATAGVRKCVVCGKSVSVSEDLGGRGMINKKKARCD